MDTIESLKETIQKLEVEVARLKKENKKLTKQLSEQNTAGDTQSDLKEEMMHSISPGNTQSNLKDWVKQQITNSSMEKLEKIEWSIPNLGLTGNLIFNKGSPVDVSDLRVYKNPGQGSCLIYSFLDALSVSYRKLSATDKGIIGDEYRRLLSQNSFFSEDEKTLLANPRQNLEEEFGKKIANFFGVNLFYLTKYGIERPIRMNESQEIVMIVNDKGHYEAVYFPVKIDDKQAFYESAGNIDTTTNNEADYFTESELPSIDEMKSIMDGTDLIQEGDNDLYVTQQYINNYLKGGSKRNKLSRKKRKNTKRKNTRRRK